jgi:hypothetical protein
VKLNRVALQSTDPTSGLAGRGAQAATAWPRGIGMFGAQARAGDVVRGSYAFRAVAS